MDLRIFGSIHFALSLVAKAQAMRGANEGRRAEGKADAYGEEAFSEIVDLASEAIDEKVEAIDTSLRAEAEKLREALEEIVANKAYSCTPHCPDVLPKLARAQWCPQCVARAALTPPPEAAKRGEG